MKSLRIFKIIVLILGLTLIIGCGKKPDNQTSKDTNSVQQDKVKQQITDDGSVPGLTGKTENTIPGNELGMSTGLPSDFPQDIPQPKNGKVIGSLLSSDGMVVTFQTDAPVKEVVEFYKSEMVKNGFKQTESGDMLMKDNGGMIGFQKDNRDVQLMLSSNENITSVVITYK
ncbi:MAG TPA: hypothetical protein VHP32_11535 [Ignavibacteria bacterium]|nr:hypothetical protein [Ignavibacteria bacterium]